MKVGVIGAGGRMGRLVVQTVTETEGMELAAATASPGSAALGRDAGELAGVGRLGVAVGDDAEALFAASDVAIEFTHPGPSARHAALAAKHRKAHVIGTSGLDAAQEAAIRAAAADAPIVYAANMSVVVTLFTSLVERVAGILGPEYDIEIVEMHHKHKIDAPSGTAVALGRAAAAGRGVALDEAAIWSREGETGERPGGAIGFAALRGGDVVGEHTVLFAGAGERMELTHRCTNRQLFARGAVRAASWAAGRPAGLYGMRDVIGLG